MVGAVVREPPAAGCVPARTADITHPLTGKLLIRSIVSSICSFLTMGPVSGALFLDQKGVSQHLRIITPPPLIRESLSHQPPPCVLGQTIVFPFMFLTPPSIIIKGRLLLCECSDVRYNIKTFHHHPPPRAPLTPFRQVRGRKWRSGLAPTHIILRH